MIESVFIRDFQKHDKLQIDFDPHITTIVGSSDVGKSAVLRALRWLLTNRPNGNGFIRNGTKHCYVRLGIDGHKILRERGPGLNSYSLDGHRFQSFGSELPADIEKILNVGPVCLQNQHDPPFWFTLSPGEISRELNQIVNLGAIDATLFYLASELRKAKTTVEVSESRLREAKEKRRELKWVAEVSTELEEIERKEQKAEKLQVKINTLESLLVEVEQAEEGQRTLGQIANEGKAIIDMGEKAIALGDEVVRLESLLGKIKETEEEHCRLRNQITTLESDLRKKLKGKCPLCGNPLNTSRCCAVIST